MTNKKTLSKIIIGLVIVFMTGLVISLSNTNHELSIKISENEQTYNELNYKYNRLEDKFDKVSNDYEKLVEGIHNKYEHKKYEIKYNYDNKTYIYEGNGKIFGECKAIIY